MAFFLCRLTAPRTTFPTDMTPEEGTAMGAHAAYWAGLAQAGTAIAVGPVADPAGFWGLAIVEAGSAEEVRGLLDDDPVTRPGLGFRYDIHPMPQVILRTS